MMRKRKILIIDDEYGFTEMVKYNLESTGRYEVMIENRGSRALHTASVYQPDLILLDIIMPDKEGPDVHHQIKSHDRLKDTPIVFLTATVRKDEVEAEKGTIAGHSFLAKPGSIHELIECIESHLSSPPG